MMVFLVGLLLGLVGVGAFLYFKEKKDAVK